MSRFIASSLNYFHLNDYWRLLWLSSLSHDTFFLPSFQSIQIHQIFLRAYKAFISVYKAARKQLSWISFAPRCKENFLFLLIATFNQLRSGKKKWKNGKGLLFSVDDYVAMSLGELNLCLRLLMDTVLLRLWSWCV